LRRIALTEGDARHRRRSFGVPAVDKVIDISRSYEQVPIHECVKAAKTPRELKINRLVH
jgi:hypothetical protein